MSTPKARDQPPLRLHTEGTSDGEILAMLGEEEMPAEGGVENVEVVINEKKKDEKVTWRSLPHRRQLIILTLARLSEPLVQTSLQVGTSRGRLWECILIVLAGRLICSINSNPSIKVCQTRRLPHKLE